MTGLTGPELIGFMVTNGTDTGRVIDYDGDIYYVSIDLAIIEMTRRQIQMVYGSAEQ